MIIIIVVVVVVIVVILYTYRVMFLKYQTFIFFITDEETIVSTIRVIDSVV